MRALVMDFGDDENVLNIGDQFMFGPSILINPVYEYGARSREVYLPEGCKWYNVRSGKFLKGGQTITAEAPYSDIPIFIKEGAIVPCGPLMEYTTEKPADPIRLFVVMGKDGEFTLYEDENTNYNYEEGKFTLIPITYNESTGILKIGKRQGKFEGMLETRTFEVIKIMEGANKAISFGSAPDEVLTYNGDEVTVKLK